jgi:hypothetical protein
MKFQSPLGGGGSSMPEGYLGKEGESSGDISTALRIDILALSD